MKYYLLSATVLLLTYSCSFPTAEEEMESEWAKFDAIVKTRIYKLIQNKDCAGLQNEFNITADNMDRIHSSGGSGEKNLKLIDFLEEKMRELGCH